MIKNTNNKEKDNKGIIIKPLDESLSYTPKDGFIDCKILKFKASKEKLIIRILTNSFYNVLNKDQDFSSYFKKPKKESLVFELEIDFPKLDFDNYISFFNFLDADIQLISIKKEKKIEGYLLELSCRYPDKNINMVKTNNKAIRDKYIGYNTDLKIFGSSFKWKIVGHISNIDDNYIEKNIDSLRKRFSMN